MENQSLERITEKTVLPFVQPKMNDLIKLIGENNMKREFSFAIQAVNSNDYLAKASPQSVAKAIWNVAITGLTLNPVHKLAYLTPRSIKGQVEAVLIPSYMGITKLLTDTGSVVNAYAHPVYEGDEFEVILGVEYTLHHKPKFQSKKMTHVYAVGVLKDGSKQFEVMSLAEVHEIRERSDGYKAFKAGKTSTAIWETDFGEMARKTVIKRLAKYLPKTERWEKLQEAIELDNSDYAASDNQVVYIERLLSTSGYDDTQRRFIETQLEDGITRGQAEKIIGDLQMNQLDPITQGGNYSQTDIKVKQQQMLEG